MLFLHEQCSAKVAEFYLSVFSRLSTLLEDWKYCDKKTFIGWLSIEQDDELSIDKEFREKVDKLTQPGPVNVEVIATDFCLKNLYKISEIADQIYIKKKLQKLMVCLKFDVKN